MKPLSLALILLLGCKQNTHCDCKKGTLYSREIRKSIIVSSDTSTTFLINQNEDTLVIQLEIGNKVSYKINENPLVWKKF